MKEQIISYEVAKLAKEKGFDIKCINYYTKPKTKMFGVDEHERLFKIKNISQKLYNIYEYRSNNISNVFFAPTQSVLAKWLREKHNIFIKIDFFQSDEFEELDFDFSIFDLTNPFKEDGVTDNPIRDYIDTGTYFFKYEEALEVALLEALKLITK